MKKLPLFTPRQALFFHRCPLDSQNDNRCAQVSWGSVLSVSQQPPQLRPDPASTAVGQQRNDAHTSTTGNRTSSTAPRMSHRPIINITTMPQDGLHAPGHVATAAPTVHVPPSSLRNPLRFCCKPRPSYYIYKRGGQGALQKDTRPTFFSL
jgi:hypothetical protein